MKAVTAYLLLPAFLFAFALQSVDGAVLCWCGDGNVAIELACDDGGCCDDAHADGETATGAHATECRDCTDVRLVGLDVFAHGTTIRTKVTFDSLALPPAFSGQQHHAGATCVPVRSATLPSLLTPQSSVVLRV